MPATAAAVGDQRSTSHYAVTTEVFEGPFDLLLHLVAREQVDLYEVSLHRIVDGYLAHLGDLGELDLEVATEFMVIAATLIELKSRRLLPAREQADDDDLDLWAERDVLLARLIECRTFKDAGAHLAHLAAGADLSWPRRAGLEERFATLVPDVLAGVTPDHLRQALVRAFTPVPPPPRVDLDHVAPIRISVAEVAEALAVELESAGRSTLRQLTTATTGRLELIVAFLAVLELYKDGLIEIDQSERFGDLSLTWLGP